MQREYPHAPFRPTGKGGDIDILIAGCGTGRHSIGIAQQFERSKVLAIDLSAASLGYAKARTGALGVTNIDYAQADILQLGATGRTFDMIQSAGVLHHLADPWAGWRVLNSLLRPGGVMFIALYSERRRGGTRFHRGARLRIEPRRYPLGPRGNDGASGRLAAARRGVLQ
jgi:SAM-dependent methyltransferase